MKNVNIIFVLILLASSFKAQQQFTNFGNLTIHPSASVTVVGNFINNGLLIDSGSVISFAGSSPQEIGGTSTSTFKNVILNNTAGSFLSANANISKELTITAGTFSAAGFALTLLSDQNGTARIAPILGDFDGNITMQRYLPSGNTGWRFLASPVNGATINDWQDNFITSGFTGSNYPSDPFISIYTYDETTPGIYDYGYNGATNATNSITPGVGYWCYIGPVPLTVDVTGPPVKFSQNLPVTFSPSSAGALHDGWVMIGNPYPSPIDWTSSSWTKTNINGAIYIWNPALEQYASWVAGIGTNGGSNLIASSQSFWIQTNATSPTLSCNENIKVSSDPSFLKINSTPAFDQLRLTIKGNAFKDEAILRFGSGATNGYDTGVDARKIFSSSLEVPGISTQDSSKEDMSINSLAPINSQIHIPVKTIVGVTGNYTISIDSTTALPSGYCIVLEDLVTGIKTSLDNFSMYSFSIADTTIAARFLIHISAPLHTEAINASCNQRKDGKAIAQGTGTGPWNYLWLDNSNNSLKQTFNTYNADTLYNIAAGNYSIKVSDVNGLCGYLTSQINISESLPVYAGFNFLKDTIIAGTYDSLVLQNNSTGAISYRWNLGDGSPIDTIFSPINHHYSFSGNYKISLIAKNGNCSDTMTHDITVISNITVGLDENKSLIKVSVFPNPNQGIFYIKRSGSTLVNGHFEVLSSSGQCIYKSIVDSEKNEINLKHVAKGIYFYTITLEDTIHHGKLVLE